ncbi:hypothetical protein HO173_001281 [Letharia columbiana]|uniref:AB hydrolase-1 domain-containing protein n=1 Tax=Letharia columbiana TaxID=112416 RepID=A0A8H6L9M1_9LECA|nr:uncharacterized protein HO173_001281 [Letharia columbiana]KAF6240610.1 hypothetical protein HO173_001281 [Letharia columbiana]
MASDTVYFNAHSSTTLPSGRTYSHVHIVPTGNKPYILFLHGFPGTSYLWRHQIAHFSARGYGIVVPDLLGYRGSDKPAELEAYRLKKMAEDVISLLETLGVGSCFAVAHDWGSFLLSRIANYYPDRFLAFTWLAIAYSPPGGRFSVDEINADSEEKLGYPFFGYWEFFNDPKTVDLVDRNVESFLTLQFASDPEQVKTSFCPYGAARAWVTAGKTSPLPPFITPAEFKTHSSFFSPSHGGSFGPPLNWYKAMLANINLADDAAIPLRNRHVTKPALFIGCAHDYVAVPRLQEAGMRPWAADLRVKVLDSAHWVQLQRREEVNRALRKFFDEVEG